MLRTLTSLDRLLDVLPALADDVRVECRFTIADGSEFDKGLISQLERAGMLFIPWSETKGNFDLAISPSNNGDLHQLDMDLITLPHGAGYHKYKPSPDGITNKISGLSEDQLLYNGRVVPNIICVSHENHLELLRQNRVEIAERAVALGDPCWDRLRASAPMRAHYRRHLGTGARTLVAVSSTWGPDSLFHQHTDLAARLASELPPDDFQIALILHPNIWTRHGTWQIRQWTARARAAGLILVPAHTAWKATLVAADTVIADHGSLSLYSAAFGKRLIMANFGANEIAPDSIMAKLGEITPRLGTRASLQEQIESAQPVPQHSEIAAKSFANIGQSIQKLRTLMYERMNLSIPPWNISADPVDPFIPGN